jgi:hypothetical protein
MDRKGAAISQAALQTADVDVSSSAFLAILTTYQIVGSGRCKRARYDRFRRRKLRSGFAALQTAAKNALEPFRRNEL